MNKPEERNHCLVPSLWWKMAAAKQWEKMHFIIQCDGLQTKLRFRLFIANIAQAIVYCFYHVYFLHLKNHNNCDTIIIQMEIFLWFHWLNSIETLLIKYFADKNSNQEPPPWQAPGSMSTGLHGWPGDQGHELQGVCEGFLPPRQKTQVWDCRLWPVWWTQTSFTVLCFYYGFIGDKNTG